MDTFRVVHWSLQLDHAHLIIEATDERALSRGMARLNTRLARLLNRIAGRRGRVFHERYHDHQLRTPREVRHAILYVLLNGHKHGAVRAGIDPISSAPMFDGWARPTNTPALPDETVRAPQTWLLRIGWRKHGLIDLGGH